MGTLSDTWFADGYIDFELKKYTLLSYLQEIHRHFNETRLYPQLADVIFHYNNLVALKDNKQSLQQRFPKRLNGVNLERLQLLYEQIVGDDEMMKELEDIIQYAIRKMDHTIRDGTEIFEFVEGSMQISPVGLIPLDLKEGYMLLCDGRYRDTLVYEYRVTIFERHDEQYRGIHLHHVEDYPQDLSHTAEHIKTLLIRQRNQLPNPAVYRVETNLVAPVAETLLPVAKRLLVKYLAQHAA